MYEVSRNVSNKLEKVSECRTPEQEIIGDSNINPYQVKTMKKQM